MRWAAGGSVMEVISAEDSSIADIDALGMATAMVRFTAVKGEGA